MKYKMRPMIEQAMNAIVAEWMQDDGCDVADLEARLDELLWGECRMLSHWWVSVPEPERRLERVAEGVWRPVS